MKKGKNLYDLTLLSERIEDLRKGNGKDRFTLEELSNDIEKKTGEYISTNTLGKYEKEGEAEKMRIGNLITIANYYNVSLDYLLGNTNSKSNNHTYQMVSKKFGLSDEAMNNLAFLTLNNSLSENALKLKLVNCIIESDWFLPELASNLSTYYQANHNKERKIIDADKQETIARYDLIYTFEKFRDDCMDKLYSQPKCNYLFGISDIKKSKGGKE